MTYDFDNIILVYHCNFNSKVIDFIDHGNLCSSDDKDYLGYGMYYWANRNDLTFWKEKKIVEAKRYSITEELVCISAKIMFNENQCLDLSTRDEFEKLITVNDFINKAHRNVNASNLGLGEVIDRVLSSTVPAISSIFKQVKVVKANLRYKSLNKGYEVSGVGYYSDKLNGNQSFSIDIRTIYCVRCNESLKFHNLISKEVAS